ncbi:ankyrin repeat, PH and SEC7 domain containing protein secG-like isoform X2 [Oscarella lobularis]|uniref:ankyrin repeat, PH and SEC7 domain containing protein secG-like isoform X2 n=1 Tax=Oscarella lobularis TaxID=121494 RepID=UPI003313225E
MQQLQNIRVLRFFRGLCFLSVDFVKKFRRWYTRSKRNSVREDGRCLCEILSWAVYLGRNDICKYVVKEAVDLSVRVIGKSPLHRAIFYDREDTTKLFVSISCRTNIVNLKDDFGLSPLFWSLLLERHDIAEYLVSKRADVQETCSSSWTFTNKIFSYMVSQIQRKSKASPISYFTDMLLQCGVGAAEEAMEETELQFWKDCLFWWSVRTQKPIDQCLKLLEIGANPDCIVWVCAAIHSAAWRGDVKMVKMNLDWGVSVEKKDNWGRTPLWYAAGYNRTDCVKLLLAKGADPLGETFDGSPLEMAQKAEQKEAVRLLEDHLETREKGKVLPDYPASLKTSLLLEVCETVADYSHEVKKKFKIMESNVKESVLCEMKEMEKRFEKFVKETVRHETKEMEKRFKKVVKETVQQELEKGFEKRVPPSTTSSASLQRTTQAMKL